MNNKKMLASTAAALLVWAGNANAFSINVHPDWNVNLDTTVQYNLGFRVKSMDDKIGNDPMHSENNYKFDKSGDIVTNRLSLLSEMDAVYSANFGTAGFRISGSMFRDFAYDSDVKNKPGYEGIGSYRNNKYSNYTKRYYVRGGQLLDAFIFSNFSVFNKPTSARLGRFTSYWGNAMFSGHAGIAYSQNAADNIKGASAPGTEAKELAIPRAQLMVSTQLANNWTLEAQHFFEFEGNRLPEGGTYLGVMGPLFNGPDHMFGGGIPHGKKHEPDSVNSNYGVRLIYQPYWLRGTLSAVYRRFDETQPWAALMATDANGNPHSYHLSYAEKVDMFALGLEKQLGTFSTGFELSYRHNTALNSVGGTRPNETGEEGARGDTLHFIANAITGLTRTKVYDTGTAMAELGFTKRLKTTDHKEMYNSTSNRALCESGRKWDGCSTDESVVFSAMVEPQWLQVYSGVDLSMPMFVQYGLYGNTPSLGANVNQGALVYTLGVKALVHNNYSLTLQYNGYNAHHRSRLTNISSPTGSEYYSGGNGAYFYNDKDWVSLTAKFSF